MDGFSGQTDSMSDSRITLSCGKRVAVKPRVYLTMADVKIINFFTNTRSSNVCYLCRAVPTERNDLDKMKSLPIKPGVSGGLKEGQLPRAPRFEGAPRRQNILIRLRTSPSFPCKMGLCICSFSPMIIQNTKIFLKAAFGGNLPQDWFSSF